MTHEQAQEQHAAERYLLGELHAGNREQFEEHLFACVLCAADVRDATLLLRAARQQFAHESHSPAAPAPRRPSMPLLTWRIAALAASLLVVIGYQNLVEVPRLQEQLARANAPSVLRELVLAGSGSRGGPAPAEVRLPASGSLLLSVDIPQPGNYEKYLCSLASPQGKLLWQIEIAPGAVENAVPLRVPAQHLNEGENILRVQGLSRQPATASAQPVDLATYRFSVRFER